MFIQTNNGSIQRNWMSSEYNLDSTFLCLLLCDQSPSNEWQKVDYLIEFSQWLYCNEFPITDALDQLQWAIDIILSMKWEVEQVKKEGKIWYRIYYWFFNFPQTPFWMIIQTENAVI